MRANRVTKAGRGSVGRSDSGTRRPLRRRPMEFPLWPLPRARRRRRPKMPGPHPTSAVTAADIARARPAPSDPNARSASHVRISVPTVVCVPSARAARSTNAGSVAAVGRRHVVTVQTVTQRSGRNTSRGEARAGTAAIANPIRIPRLPSLRR
jgi:hypothetical protein